MRRGRGRVGVERERFGGLLDVAEVVYRLIVLVLPVLKLPPNYRRSILKQKKNITIIDRVSSYGWTLRESET